MAFTQAKQNDYDFSEKTLGDMQVTVTNNLGRDAKYAELVYLDGYFGEVREPGGIANGETGKIKISSDRIIRTGQIEATDTFTVGNVLWFVSGGAGAAGTLEDADPGSGTRLKVGMITGSSGSGGSETYVEFMPFVQRLDEADVEAQVETNTAAIGTLSSLTTTEQGSLVGAINEVDGDVGDLSTLTTTEQGSAVGAINEVDANADTNASDISTLQTEMLAEQAEPKILVQKITADASAGIAVSGLVENDEIVSVSVICTATNASGTLVVETGGGDDITDGIACDTDTAVDYAATIDDDYSTLPASGAQIISVGGTAANTRGIVVITYIPA